jgi:nicotinamidase-related amidase
MNCATKNAELESHREPTGPTEEVKRKMASAPVRDQLADHLITPQNAALVLIDYQPEQFSAVRSMDRDLLLKNIVSTVKIANTFRLPMVHSTVNVASGRVKTTVPDLNALLQQNPPIDQTTLNAWEDPGFLALYETTPPPQESVAA